MRGQLEMFPERPATPRRRVHPPRRIERPDLLRAHLTQEHGYADDGLFPMPEKWQDCYALHDELHRQMGGGYFRGASK